MGGGADNSQAVQDPQNGNGKNNNVPEVSYKLWAETFRLLLKYRSKHETLALANRNGRPLKVETIVNGRAKKIDNIRSAYNRLALKLKIHKTPKLLRKTAATKLGQHAESRRFAQYFLGHAPATVADKFYVAPSAQKFDEAVDGSAHSFSTRPEKNRPGLIKYLIGPEGSKTRA